MSLRRQIKQKVMDLAYKAEMALHHFRKEFEDKSPPSSPSKTRKERKEDSGKTRTYYSDAKEERKLH
ncbi:MAG: hypothetical protein WCY48_04045 [Candidatus Caldatribacteriota bacterium]